MTVDIRKRPPADAISDDPPPVVVERVRPFARCHACGDGVVEAVCSHCARLLCHRHLVAAGPLGPRAVLELFRTDSKAAAAPRAGEATANTGGKATAAAGDPGLQKSGVQKPGDEKPGDEKPGNEKPGDEKPDNDKPGDQTPGDQKSEDQASGVQKSGGQKSENKKSGVPKLDKPGGKRSKDSDSNDEEERAGERLGARPRGSAHRHYCTTCVPRARPFDAELIAATMTAGLGAAVFPVQSAVGLLLLSAGVLRFGVRTVMGLRRRAQQAGDHSADLVLNPNLRKIKTRERIKGTIRLLPDRRFQASVGEVSGSVAIEGNWSRVHRAEVDRHRRITRSEPTSVAAGHLVLHGPGRVAFRPVTDAVSNGGPALVLEPRVADQPVLSSANGLGETQWHPDFTYNITPPEEGWRLPVWISPNIAADLDRHVLELHVQWCTRGPGKDDDGVPLRAIEVLEMAVPAHWGTVEFMTKLDGDTYTGQPEASEDGRPARRTLTWKKISFKAGPDRGSVRLTVRFSERIDLDHELTGRIEARFAGAMSGLTRTVMYRTDGGRVNGLDGMNKPVTIADVSFTLSLAGLRYQEQRAIPDRSRAEDVRRRETETFPGVVPDHQTVALLTNNLADEGYSIIRVQENPAQSSPRPGAVNRLWDLAGRYYEGVYPIEFHLQLSGEEVHKGQQVSGSTAVTLTVHGSYANTEMERRVVEEWTRLWNRIRLSMPGAGDGPRLVEQPLDAAESELARLRNVALTEVARVRAAADAGQIETDLAAEMVERITREFGLGEG